MLLPKLGVLSGNFAVFQDLEERYHFPKENDDHFPFSNFPEFCPLWNPRPHTTPYSWHYLIMLHLPGYAFFFFLKTTKVVWASLFFYLMFSCFCYLWVYFYLKSEDIHEERYMWWLSWKEKVKKHGYVNSVEIYICQKYERRRMGLLSCEYTRQKPYN